MPETKLKYTIYFKNKDGSHHSTKTMSQDEYICFLENVIAYLIRPSAMTEIPSRFFEVEERRTIYSTLMD